MKMETPTEKTETQPKEEEAAHGKKEQEPIKRKNQHGDKKYASEKIQKKQIKYAHQDNKQRRWKKIWKRARATTWTHSMGRHRTNRIQSTNTQMGMPIRRLPTNHG